jgi:hypothetical protein
MATVVKESGIECLRMHGSARFLRVGLGVYPRQFAKRLQSAEGKRVARRFVAGKIEIEAALVRAAGGLWSVTREGKRRKAAGGRSWISRVHGAG